MVDITRPVYGDVWANTGEKLAPDPAKIATGWIQEMMPYQYENFLQNRADTAITYLLQKGVAEWSSDQEYIANKSVVTYSGQLYMATATTTNVLPTVTASWKKLSVSFGVNGAIPISFGGTGATTAADARTNLGIGSAGVVNLPVADGLLIKQGNSLISRTIEGTPNYITVSNGDGQAGNLVISVGANVAKTDTNTSWTSTGSIKLPAGSTSEQGTATPGKIRFNNETGEFHGAYADGWKVLAKPSTASETTILDSGDYYTSGNVEGALQYVGETLSNAILLFPDYATAEAAAASLPDGQMVEAGEFGYTVSGGFLTQKRRNYVNSVRVFQNTNDLANSEAIEGDFAEVVSADGGRFKFTTAAYSENGVTVISGVGGCWVRDVERQFFASWAGVSQENPDSSSGIQKIINIAKSRKFVPYDSAKVGVSPVVYGTRELVIDADQITAASPILIDGNIELSGWSSQQACVYNYTGADRAITINSNQPDDYTTAVQLVQAATIRGLHVKAYAGTYGVFCGAATFRDVQFYSGSISGVTNGTGIFMGEATYGGTLDGFDLYGCAVGLHFNDYCDLITVRNSWIGGNSQVGILVEGPTFNFENLNVEGNSGVGIQIIHREGNRNGLRAGRITGCRFGDEEWPQVPASRDIEFTVIPGAGVGAIAGTVIENNKFFTGGETPKLVPILINGPVTNLSIRGNFRSSAYSSGYLVQATAAAYGNGAMYDSYIDDITQVDPAARALFNRCENKTYARFVATASIVAGYAVEATGYSGPDGAGARLRSTAIASGDVAAQRRIIGIADYSENTVGRPVWIRTKGAVVDVAIPYNAAYLNAPIYHGHGAMTLTPPAGVEPFIVGTVVGESASGNTKMLVLVG